MCFSGRLKYNSRQKYSTFAFLPCFLTLENINMSFFVKFLKYCLLSINTPSLQNFENFFIVKSTFKKHTFSKITFFQSAISLHFRERVLGDKQSSIFLLTVCAPMHPPFYIILLLPWFHFQIFCFDSLIYRIRMY